MDQVFSKVGSYWLSQKAGNELSTVGNDVNSLSTSIEGGTKWLVNKIKGRPVHGIGPPQGAKTRFDLLHYLQELDKSFVGKMQTPLPEFLKEYDLATGIFPRNATNYEFDEETKKLTVYIPSVCEVGYKDDSVLRFSTTVTGCLEKGKLSEIVGIKTKVLVWMKVTCITSEKSKMHFQASGIWKARSRDAYEVERDGITVSKF